MEHDNSTWFKIWNRNYFQRVGRAELFERDRHRERTPGWHACTSGSEDLRHYSTARRL